jgi:hypothetical protein
VHDFIPAARVIADSLGPHGHRLTTIEASMHRFVLAEFNTHRALSRNSASSRAVPVGKTMSRLADSPAVPLSWPTEQRGMTGGDELDDTHAATARAAWLAARDAAVHYAETLSALGVHKSISNRLMEPFAWTTVIASGTDWDSFFAQRCSPLAQPEIRIAAHAIHAAYRASTPTPVPAGDWHLPYIDATDRTALPAHALRHVSAARCARVSYLTHDGRRDHSADLELYQRLIDADPPHASPLEHVATPADMPPRPRGNLHGWHQLRHLVLGDA